MDIDWISHAIRIWKCKQPGIVASSLTFGIVYAIKIMGVIAGTALCESVGEKHPPSVPVSQC